MQKVSSLLLVAMGLGWACSAVAATNLELLQAQWSKKASLFDIQDAYDQCVEDMRSKGALPASAKAESYACANAALTVCATPESVHGLSQFRCIDAKAATLSGAFAQAAIARAASSAGSAAAPTVTVVGTSEKTRAMAALHTYTEAPVCRSVVSTGSRFAHQECHTAFEWKQMNDDAADDVRYFQQRSETFAFH